MTHHENEITPEMQAEHDAIVEQEDADRAAFWRDAFDVDDPGVNVGEEISWIVRGVVDRANAEGEDNVYEWTRALSWLAAAHLPAFDQAIGKQTLAGRMPVRDAIMDVAMQLVRATALDSEQMLEYADVRGLDRAYQRLGAALEAWKDTLDRQTA